MDKLLIDTAITENMDNNEGFDLAVTFSDKDSFYNLINQDQLHGLVAILVGASQLPLAFSIAKPQSLTPFVIGSGGLLLISIGFNIFREKDPFGESKSENKWTTWLSTAMLVILSLAIVVVAISISLT